MIFKLLADLDVMVMMVLTMDGDGASETGSCAYVNGNRANKGGITDLHKQQRQVEQV